MADHNAKAIILAAGPGTRWENYLGVPKQMVVIDNEALLQRTIRQITEKGITDMAVSVPRKGHFGDLGVKEIVGKSDNGVCKVLNVEKEASNGSILFWGDVYFTDYAMDVIFADNNPFQFFGRAGASELTGKKYGEIFAVKVNKFVFEKCHELEAMANELRRAATWELYRLINQLPLTRHIIGDHFTEINDLTEDFDYPVDFDNWQKHGKNQCLNS